MAQDKEAARRRWLLLLDKMATAPAESANIAVLDAALMLVAAGQGLAAHQLLLNLLHGELHISPASLCRPRLAGLLPGLSHGLGLPCPDLPELGGQGLSHYMEAIGQADWASQLEDRFATPLPISAAWTSVPASVVEDWLARGAGRLGQIRAGQQSWQQQADFLRDTYRLIQQLCRHDQLIATAPLFELYDALCNALGHARNDAVSQALTSLRLTVLVRLGQGAAARELLHSGARKTTAWIESVFSRPTGARLLLDGALRDEFPLSASDAAAAADALTTRRRHPPQYLLPCSDDWAEFLAAWNDDFFARRTRDRSYLDDYYPEQMAQQDLGAPGASPDDIAALEQRLGRSLPASYRNFLLSSNGWLVADGADQLLAAADVGWFVEQEPEWVAAWQEAFGGKDVDDEHYFQRGAHQDATAIRASCLASALQISSSADGYVFLLIPDVVDAHGEWEAWDLGVKLPGANRFRNFYEMLAVVRERSTR